MRKEQTHQAEEWTEDEDNEGSWIDNYPSETIEAVPPNEVSAGINVTLYDLDTVDAPAMVELHQYYPPEDDAEGDSVFFHGEHAALQVMSALSKLLSERFEEVPWEDV